MYLEEHEALPLLAAIGEIAAPGSWIAADVVNPEVLTSPYMGRYMAALREAGSPWKFGIEDPESFFQQRAAGRPPSCSLAIRRPAMAAGRLPPRRAEFPACRARSS
jgi:O-methyltransferase involved in polyketide biosynthesis